MTIQALQWNVRELKARLQHLDCRISVQVYLASRHVIKLHRDAISLRIALAKPLYLSHLNATTFIFAADTFFLYDAPFFVRRFDQRSIGPASGS